MSSCSRFLGTIYVPPQLSHKLTKKQKKLVTILQFPSFTISEWIPGFSSSFKVFLKLRLSYVTYLNASKCYNKGNTLKISLKLFFRKILSLPDDSWKPSSNFQKKRITVVEDLVSYKLQQNILTTLKMPCFAVKLNTFTHCA